VRAYTSSGWSAISITAAGFGRDWDELIAAARVEKDQGTDPSDLRIQKIAARWTAS
jgi:hypothetical protein